LSGFRYLLALENGEPPPTDAGASALDERVAHPPVRDGRHEPGWVLVLFVYVLVLSH
jgi:hypothetical protein